MHRAAFHFIKALGIPSRTKGKGKRVQTADEDEQDDAEDDENMIDDNEGDIDTSMDIDAAAESAEDMAETLVVDFEPGDTLGKLIAFVNQVRISSEGVREYLGHACRTHNVKAIELRLWVRSRWGSLTHCLSATLEVQKVRFPKPVTACLY
jgi:hypothetical protein